MKFNRHLLLYKLIPYTTAGKKPEGRSDWNHALHAGRTEDKPAIVDLKPESCID